MFALLLLALQDPAPAPSARAAQRLELVREVLKTNGVWKLHEWGHYFVVTSVDESKFLEELERHAFEAREFCSRLFPEAECDPVRDDRRLVVLRVAGSRQEYESYGGPAGSTGYWSGVSGEIVVHDDSQRDETWAALGGCVTRAFLDEYFGNLPRAYWFEEGLADLAASRFEISASRSRRPRPSREERLRKVNEAGWPTLEHLLSGAGTSDQDMQIVAWSLMHFLCDEQRRGQDVDPRWASIPERYAVGGVLLMDEGKARDFAFEGLDRAALESAWRASLRP